MKVIKFGGGCFKDVDHFQRVVEIIKKENQAAAVVSAVAGVTDLLIDGIQKALESEKVVPDIISAIRDKHTKIIETLIQNPVIQENTSKDIEVKLTRLERLLFGISYTGEITESTRARLISYGERLAAITLAGILVSSGKEAMAMEADKIGIISDYSFDKATANLTETENNLRKNVLPAVAQGKIPVVTGFFGCTPEGKITTFGRGGTDYSASVIAYCNNAVLLEIWKDVEGFMSADPRIVQNPHKIDRLSYYEAAELSYFGAKILHPRTVEPLVEARIPIAIRNLYEPDESGTQVSSGGYEKEDIIKSVTYNKEISVLRIQGPGVGYKPGIIAEVGRILSDTGINIFSVITSQTSINLLVDESDVHRSFNSLKQLEGGIIERVDLEKNLALIAVVGEGLLQKKGLAARVFSAVAEKEINIEMTSAGASEVAYYFIVKDTDLEKAILAVHDEFFKKGSRLNI